jgi:hypothetical protein
MGSVLVIDKIIFIFKINDQINKKKLKNYIVSIKIMQINKIENAEMKLKWCKLKKLVQTKMLNGILRFFASKKMISLSRGQYRLLVQWIISVLVHEISIGWWTDYSYFQNQWADQ